MADKVDTRKGGNIYRQRIAITEPVFANIRHVKKLGRFTISGKIKDDVHWVLYCMVYNIQKILNYGSAWLTTKGYIYPTHFHSAAAGARHFNSLH
ncbi:MAG: hypothetical protein FJ117_08640 [Deltaproteobacteria bacterium]|nr:hypothetical protein [Deltaproteobacteria bacterium]